MQREKMVVWETKRFDQIIVLEPVPQVTIDNLVAKLIKQGSKKVEILRAY